MRVRNTVDSPHSGLFFDLLCVDENEAIVVDYKTGSSDRAGNEAQVSLYKRAVEQILGLKTRAFVVYCLNLGVELCEIKK